MRIPVGGCVSSSRACSSRATRRRRSRSRSGTERSAVTHAGQRVVAASRHRRLLDDVGEGRVQQQPLVQRDDRGAARHRGRRGVGEVLGPLHVAQQQVRLEPQQASTGRESSHISAPVIASMRPSPVSGGGRSRSESASRPTTAEPTNRLRVASPCRSCPSSWAIIATRSCGSSPASSGSPSTSTRRRRHRPPSRPRSSACRATIASGSGPAERARRPGGRARAARASPPVRAR